MTSLVYLPMRNSPQGSAVNHFLRLHPPLTQEVNCGFRPLIFPHLTLVPYLLDKAHVILQNGVNKEQIEAIV